MFKCTNTQGTEVHYARRNRFPAIPICGRLSKVTPYEITNTDESINCDKCLVIVMTSKD